MHTTGMSFKAIGRQMGYHYTVVDRRLLGSQCCLSTGLVANGIRLTKRCNALSSRSDVTRGLPDLGKSFTLRIWVFKSGVLNLLFILSKHGTKANIKSTKMANNRHAYNWDVAHLFNGTLFLL
jgi:hypothetical protein